MIEFQSPLFLLLLLLLPFVAYITWTRPTTILFSSKRKLQLAQKKKVIDPRYFLLGMRLLALTLLIVAFARPQSGKSFKEVNSNGVDIMIAMDTSGSMQALDFFLDKERVDRLTIVKKVAKEFILNRPSDRIGLVVFGSEAFTQCPLTLDHDVLLDLLDQTKQGVAGDATAIGDALGVSVKRMKGLKAKSKVIILVTDGRSNSGVIDPKVAGDMAESLGIKIYTIGVGTSGKVPIPINHPIYGRQIVYEEQDLDEPTLKALAENTRGVYYRASATNDLEKIYKEIDRLEKTKVDIKQYTEYEELYHWFVLAGLLLIATELILSLTILRRFP